MAVDDNGKNSGRENEWMGFGTYVMCPCASGLEGKLQGVKVGDFLLLSSPQVIVAGFVQRWDSKRVELTYFDPNCIYEWDRKKVVEERYTKGNRSCNRVNDTLDPENRTYNLSHFQSYALLPDVIPASNSDGYSPSRSLTEMTLQNKPGRESFVNEARIGDLVLLDDSKLRVGGFVTKKSEFLLTMSHVDPNSELQGNVICGKGYAKGWFFYGQDPVIFNTINFKQALLFPRRRSLPLEVGEEDVVPVEEVVPVEDNHKASIVYSDFSDKDPKRRIR